MKRIILAVLAVAAITITAMSFKSKSKPTAAYGNTVMNCGDWQSPSGSYQLTTAQIAWMNGCKDVLEAMGWQCVCRSWGIETRSTGGSGYEVQMCAKVTYISADQPCYCIDSEP
jgi:hypothetical protein